MLREEQIQRYSRQILLTPVGGVGQERLLQLQVRLEGGGAAAAVAMAYLAAGGSSLVPGVETEWAPGFLLTAAERTGTALQAALGELNADAAPRPGQLPALLAEAPHASALAEGLHAQGQPRVLLGAEGGVARVAAVSATGCGRCLWALGRRWEEVPAALATATGALAALALQRLALRLAAPQGAWSVFPDGRIEVHPWPGCEACPPGAP